MKQEVIRYDELNQAQSEAMTTIEGPLLVLAGAGSGKTRVVTYRIAYMIEQGIDPSSILGLTFTNKAANEMLERIRKLTDSFVRISTFHSIGAYILRHSIEELGYPSHFTIYDEEDTLKLIRACIKETEYSSVKVQIKGVKSAISQRKNSCLSMEEIDILEKDEVSSRSMEEQVALAIAKQYQEKLKQAAALDFDDLLYLTLKLFKSRPDVLKEYQNMWKYLLIDEYQDTNQVQNQLVKLLISHTNNICVVGDPDQSIYSWRGAEISHILDFPKVFHGAKVVHLGQNYRTRPNILEAAGSLITHNKHRLKKEMWSAKKPGEMIKKVSCHTDYSEARFIAAKLIEERKKLGIPLKECAIFYRTNGQSRVLEDALLSQRIPYQIIGGISFYQRKEVKDILAYLKLLVFPNDILSFERAISLPKRGIGGQSIEKLVQASLKENLPMITYCEKFIDDQKFPISIKQKSSLKEFINLLALLKEMSQEKPLEDVVRAVIQRSGYLGVLRADKDTFEDRVANLDALIGKAMEWRQEKESPDLVTFLEELSLRASIDESDGSLDCVHLMTLHNSKGLEYSLVFLVGIEEGLFPHVNSRGSQASVEEERRLCYVGMTRAKEMLYLSHAFERFIWGGRRRQTPSRFLREITPHLVETVRASV